ncbi:uncharacterized protein [Typha angustifolia]|uniref:uncharacterized protein n=1 Tax=Typha angustifolia TaxID=59011 RepID=UPI003C2F308F
MGEEGDEGQEMPQPSQPQFLEVSCKTSKKVRRFAAGTEARHALYMINRKLTGAPPALYIEAIKEGEEPVSFGPNAILVNYGKGWKLQTVTEEGDGEAYSSKLLPNTMKQPEFQSVQKEPTAGFTPIFTLEYLGKLLFAFVFIFLLGGIFTFFLESLPWLISYFSSDVDSVLLNSDVSG